MAAPALGTEVGDFRLERPLGSGSRATVYEATQLSLDRRVALKLFAPDSDLEDRLAHLRWPDHPNAVSLYAAGDWEGGHFAAMQLVRGSTLAELLDGGLPEPGRALAILGDAAAALDAAHRGGIVPGAVDPRNVLVDATGRALLSDFGLATGDADMAADIEAFGVLTRRCVGNLAPRTPAASTAMQLVQQATAALPRPGRFPRRRALAAAAGGAALVVLALIALTAPGGNQPQRAPPVVGGAEPLGSSLPGTGITSVDCEGKPPSGGSLSCSLAQLRLAGRGVVADRDGVIRRWVVRGADGELALQVIRRRDRRFDAVGRSLFERVPDEGPHAFAANLPVRAGDLVGLEIAPGAAVGVREAVSDAETARWFGPLTSSLRPAESGAGTGFDYELLLRVDFAPGARWVVPGWLKGRTAETAPPGRELAEVELSRAARRRVALVNFDDRIVLDLFERERRVARVPVEGADAGGGSPELSELRRPMVRVQWRNPDGGAISHDYEIDRRLRPRN